MDRIKLKPGAPPLDQLSMRLVASVAQKFHPENYQNEVSETDREEGFREVADILDALNYEDLSIRRRYTSVGEVMYDTEDADAFKWEYQLVDSEGTVWTEVADDEAGS